MRRIMTICLLILSGAVLAGVYAQQAEQTRPLVFVAIYERGSAWDDSKGAFQQTGINEHRDYLRLNGEKLLAAAPFLQGIGPGASDRTVGMVMVPAATQEEAQALVGKDPAVAGNLMKVTVRRWLVERVKAY